MDNRARNVPKARSESRPTNSVPFSPSLSAVLSPSTTAMPPASATAARAAARAPSAAKVTRTVTTPKVTAGVPESPARPAAPVTSPYWSPAAVSMAMRAQGGDTLATTSTHSSGTSSIGSNPVNFTTGRSIVETPTKMDDPPRVVRPREVMASPARAPFPHVAGSKEVAFIKGGAQPKQEAAKPVAAPETARAVVPEVKIRTPVLPPAIPPAPPSPVALAPARAFMPSRNGGVPGLLLGAEQNLGVFEDDMYGDFNDVQSFHTASNESENLSAFTGYASPAPEPVVAEPPSAFIEPGSYAARRRKARAKLRAVVKAVVAINTVTQLKELRETRQRQPSPIVEQPRVIQSAERPSPLPSPPGDTMRTVPVSVSSPDVAAAVDVDMYDDFTVIESATDDDGSMDDVFGIPSKVANPGMRESLVATDAADLTFNKQSLMNENITGVYGSPFRPQARAGLTSLPDMDTPEAPERMMRSPGATQARSKLGASSGLPVTPQPSVLRHRNNAGTAASARSNLSPGKPTPHSSPKRRLGLDNVRSPLSAITDNVKAPQSSQKKRRQSPPASVMHVISPSNGAASASDSYTKLSTSRMQHLDQDPTPGRGSLDSVLGIAASLCDGDDNTVNEQQQDEEREEGEGEEQSRAPSVSTFNSAAADASGPRTTPTLEMTAASLLMAAGTSSKALKASIPQLKVPQPAGMMDGHKPELPESLLSKQLSSKSQKEDYRPSDCMNEDDYDYVIIVRVSKQQLQEETSRAKAAQTPLPAVRRNSKRRLIGSPSPLPKNRTGALHPTDRRTSEDGASDSASQSDSDALSASSEEHGNLDSERDSGDDTRRSSVGTRVMATLSSWARRSVGSRATRSTAGDSSSAPSSTATSASGLDAAASVDHVSVHIHHHLSSIQEKKARRLGPRRSSSSSSSSGDSVDEKQLNRKGITAPKLSRRVTWSRLVVGSESNSDEEDDTAAGEAGSHVAVGASSIASSDASPKRRTGGQHNHINSNSKQQQHTHASTPKASGRNKRRAAAADTPKAPKPIHKCVEVIAALRAAGLFAKRVRSLSRRTWLLKIRAPEWRLELEAERIHLRMRRRDGGWSRFKRSMRAAFVPNIASSDSDDTTSLADLYSNDPEHTPAQASLFHSSDRQTLIDHILRSSSREGGADLGEATPLGAYVTHMFPLHMQARLEELRNDWLSIWRPLKSQAHSDRIGTVDQSVYAPRKLVDISAAAPPAPPIEPPRAPEKASASNTAVSKDSSGSGRNSWCCTRCCGAIASCFCKCGRSISRLFSRMLSQPLDRIAAYYGETVAFYFAWLEFYTQWLVLPAVAGLLLFLGQIYSGSLDIAYVPLFSLLMAVWSILFLEFWKRRNSVLAQRWGVLQYEDEEVVRPQYTGKWQQDVATGAVVRIYPRWKRALKYMVTIPIMLAFIAGIVLVMVLVFSTRDHVLEQFHTYEAAVEERNALIAALNGTATNVTIPPEPVLAIDLKESVLSAWTGGLSGFLDGSNAGGDASPTTPSSSTVGTTQAEKLSLDMIASKLTRFESFFTTQHSWSWWLAMTIPPIVYGSCMPLFDMIFNKIALMFNDWENHATESSYRNHRIAKVFFFRFMSAFVSLFYYAFSPQHSLLTLFIQLAAFLIIGQLLGNVAEVGGATFRVACRECRARRKVTGAEDSGLAEGRRGRRLLRHAQSQAWVEARLPQYDTFHDYAEMLIQFGYVTFFSWAFPLAPLCALFNNMIEMRSDAYKLCHLTQRPIAHKAGGIGVWYNVLVSMSILAVLTNCAHLALTSKQFRIYFPNMTDAQRLLLVFVFEHIVLSLRLLMAYIIPPVPAAVTRRATRDAWALAKLQGRRSVGELSNNIPSNVNAQ